MLFTKGNRIILTLLLLAFIGQPLASVSVFCPMPGQASNNSMAMTMDGMDHSSHINGVDNIEQGIDTCCDHDGSCPMSACAPAMMLFAAFNVSGDHASTGIMPLHTIAFVEAIVPSLYRPPIPR